MRFNPPPNWPPAPPGWTPPPGWQPEPSWPPVPPGWPLWIPDAPRRKTGLIIGAIAAVLLIGVGVVVAFVATSNDAPVTGSAAPTAVADEKTEAERLFDAIGRFEQAWNDEDFDALTGLMCADMIADPEFDPDALRALRDGAGWMDVTINSVDVDGDSATATLTQRGEGPEDVGFVREDGDWKMCDF